MEKVGIGVIGCGMISEIYMNNCVNRYSNLKLVACADLKKEASDARAKQFGCKSLTVDELLNDPEVEIVLNLTIPAQHSIVSARALNAGKHVYTEKPMFIDTEEGKALIELANSKKLYIGNAPDCFLGAGQQTCRKALDEGVIGKPFAAQAFMFSKGPERFHPNPKFFYEKGAGPVLDWGPYYISSLVSLFGPIKKIVSLGRTPSPIRKALSPKSPYYNQEFKVEVPTYVTSLLEFESGFIANLTTSFDMQYPYWESGMPFIRIFGTNGSLDVPDVNMYGGPVVVCDNEGAKKNIPLVNRLTENCRGIGLSDMARAIREKTNFRANGEFGQHVAEVLVDIQKSVDVDGYYSVNTTCNRPEPLTDSLLAGLCK